MLNDLVTGEAALPDAGLARGLLNQLQNLRVRQGLSVFVIPIPTGASLLAEAAHRAEFIVPVFRWETIPAGSQSGLNSGPRKGPIAFFSLSGIHAAHGGPFPMR